MNTPYINIEYNRFLDPIFISWIKIQPKFHTWSIPSREQVKKKVSIFRKVWQDYQEKIFQGLYETSGLEFKRNHIDIHVVSGNPRSFSFPIVIKSGYSDNEFIEVVTHELIHCLFKDNKVKEPYPNNKHIIVHAILKTIYLDYLDSPQLLTDNITRSSLADNPEYKEAWDYLETNNYRKIIAAFKNSISITLS